MIFYLIKHFTLKLSNCLVNVIHFHFIVLYYYWTICRTMTQNFRTYETMILQQKLNSGPVPDTAADILPGWRESLS